MKYHFEITKDEDGIFLGECVELDSCISDGKNKEELHFNLNEALHGVLMVNFGTNYSHPLPDESLDTNPELLQVEVSEDVALTVMLRYYRTNKHLTQETMQKAMGLKSRNSYVKLESKGNPTIRTIGKILRAFPDFPISKCFSVDINKEAKGTVNA